MIKRVQVALAILLVMLAGVIAWQAMRLREPVYQGKRLSFWLESLCKAVGNQDEVDRAEQAIRHVGTNACQYIRRASRTGYAFEADDGGMGAETEARPF